MPDPTNLFTLLYGEGGTWDYAWLSNTAHGSIFTVMLRHRAVITKSPDYYVDSWRRVLVATRNLLDAAGRVHDLRGRDSDGLREAFARHAVLSQHFEAWIDSQQAATDQADSD